MKKERTPVRIITATEAKNRFGEMIRYAYLDNEHLIIERGGIPVAAIVPIADYQRLVDQAEVPVELAESLDRIGEQEIARRSLLEFLGTVHNQIPAVPEEVAERDITEAVREVRAEQ